MTEKVTDEMLMAFVDGETDEATAAEIERILAADADLAARAEMFRASRKLVRDAFGGAHREPAPEALVEAVLRAASDAPSQEERNTNVTPFPRRPAPRFALPLAACLAVAFAGAGYVVGQLGSGGDPFAHAAVAEALGRTKSGETRSVTVAGHAAQLETLGAYRVAGGICRSFSLSGSQARLSGVGCDRGDGWSIDLTVAQGGGDGLYAPASGAALHSIDAYLDALEASPPLSPDEEAELARR